MRRRREHGGRSCAEARYRVLRWSRSWATSITARPACSTRSVTTTVAEGEAGGITQHIGAYKVAITDTDSPAYGREIVFLDTPGHEAFTRMRARGAKVTDIVVLVVAADDGVMPQTLEAIDHAKAAECADHRGGEQDRQAGSHARAREEAARRSRPDAGRLGWQHSIRRRFGEEEDQPQPADGNDLPGCRLAGPEGESGTRWLSGVVLEAKLDRGRGPVATVLVQNGTLRTGDNFVVGNVFGKVRAMFDDRGAPLDEAGPSTPVEILGLEGLPQAGDQLHAWSPIATRRADISEYRTQKAREAQLAKSSRVSLEGLAEQIKNAGVKELAIILKGDVQGSVEVLADLLTKLSNEQVKIKVLRSRRGRDHRSRRAAGVGVERDHHRLQRSSGAQGAGTGRAGEGRHPPALDHLRTAGRDQEGHDRPARTDHQGNLPGPRGSAATRSASRRWARLPVATCSDGVIKRDSEVRLLRDNVLVFKGKIGSLRRFKDDACEVRNGMECGIAIAGYGDIKVGDVIEAFVTEKVAAEAIA